VAPCAQTLIEAGTFGLVLRRNERHWIGSAHFN
jgi:hypothetical protein